MHTMTFEDAQFIYDNMTEPEYPDENEVEQDYEPDLEEDDEDFNAECRWW
jgi:hypothetical protein